MAGRQATLILNGKLAPPRISKSRAIDRTRFAERRDMAWDVACVCLVAPPGFGKTTLLAQWFEHAWSSGRRAAWLTCEEADQDPASFARHLAKALSIRLEDQKETLSHAADMLFGLDGTAAAASLLEALPVSADPLMLMIDESVMTSW